MGCAENTFKTPFFFCTQNTAGFIPQMKEKLFEEIGFLDAKESETGLYYRGRKL